MRTYDLIPTDGRKSFYGKATVTIYSSGTEYLESYGTPVIRKDSDGSLHRLWEGWSWTTGRHIKAFCGITKKEWDKMKVETL